MINKRSDVTSLDNSQLNVLNAELESIRTQALSIKHTSKLPTINSVSEGQVVIYDDGAGTKRLYVVTAKKNLGYVTLT